MLMPDTDFHRYAAECQHNDAVRALAIDKAYRAQQADTESCATCSMDLESGWVLSDTGKRICFRCEESAIEAARCQHCGKDDCREHTNAELLARGGGDL